MTAKLFLRRMSVHRGVHALYDQAFRLGVNIIHGDNGSGKTTIADFIYFALGGDLKEWRDEARLADYVLAEIQAGDAVLTLKRDVSDAAMRPMQIFFGPYEDAVALDFRLWESFPYKRPENTGYSFSQVLFRYAGIPEAISDGVSNITMNQLLRVLYADQMTPIQRIFRVEPWDTWQIRQAVGDLLCGVGGYDLYALHIILRDLKKDYDAVSARLKSLISVASSYGDDVLSEHVNAALNRSIKERDELSRYVSELLDRADEAIAGSEAETLVKDQRKELISARTLYSDTTDKIETLEFEVADAEQFIEHLKESLADFSDASSTFFALGAVRFEFCPACFASLSDSESRSDEHTCHLCGSVEPRDHDESRTLAVKLDLEMQLKESLQLQADREGQLVHLKSTLRSVSARLRAAVAASELGRRGAASKFEALIADSSRKIGYLDSQIAQLEHRLALSQEIAVLSEQKADLNGRISEFDDKIKATESAQQRRKRIAYTAIGEGAKNLLARDMAKHSDFGNIDSVNFSFSEDWVAINGNKTRIGSASGMVVLKNSFLLSLFSASLTDDQFGLPRFMLMDNIEDKGMREERSWNFQHLILEVSEATKVEHQFIFTTSGIAPDLENTPYVVGRKYTTDDHSLAIAGARSVK